MGDYLTNCTAWSVIGFSLGYLTCYLQIRSRKAQPHDHS